MIVAILIVLNIPIFLLIGWVVFDSKENAADTFYESFLHLLKVLFVPPIIRVLMGDETDGSFSTLSLLAYFVACAAAIGGQYMLLQHYFPSWFPAV